jgi:hypothetical protein
VPNLIGQETIPFDVIAAAFVRRDAVLFLGAGASLAGADATHALPSAHKLAELLVSGKAMYPGPVTDPLSKIAQYIEEVPADRRFLLGKIASLFCDGIQTDYKCAVTEFLQAMPAQRLPRLIVTTNYDVLVERSLRDRGVPYLVISHIVGNSKLAGRYFCFDSRRNDAHGEIWTGTQVEDHFVETGETARQEGNTEPVIIYKIHGTAQSRTIDDSLVDTMVLTESDYIEFLERERLKKIPSKVLGLLRRSNLLFLGYSLQDWNFRVLLQRLQRLQSHDGEAAMKHWACRLGESDEVERCFWEKRGVNLYSLPLEDFLPALLTTVERG